MSKQKDEAIYRKGWDDGFAKGATAARFQLEAENAELRDDLQRANDAVLDAEHDESRAWDRARKVEAENAKLRELVRCMHDELVSCEDNGYVCGGHKFDERVRELGVEA